MSQGTKRSPAQRKTQRKPARKGEPGCSLAKAVLVLEDEGLVDGEREEGKIETKNDAELLIGCPILAP